MASLNNNSDCRKKCWWVAAFVGILAAALLFWLVGFGALASIIFGVITGIVSGFVLISVRCNATEVGGAAVSTEMVLDVKQETGEITPDTVLPKDPSPAEGSSEVEPKPSEAQSVAPVHEEVATTLTDDAAPAEATKETVVEIHAPSNEEERQPQPQTVPEGNQKPVMLLGSARPEGKDDLQLISGVGPKLEQTLNDLGIYHFDQISKWDANDIAWVDGNLRFKGRIERDDWMAQAQILAEGGETEASRKKKKK